MGEAQLNNLEDEKHGGTVANDGLGILRLGLE